MLKATNGEGFDLFINNSPKSKMNSDRLANTSTKSFRTLKKITKQSYPEVKFITQNYSNLPLVSSTKMSESGVLKSALKNKFDT
jgi:hypothetical protein